MFPIDLSHIEKQPIRGNKQLGEKKVDSPHLIFVDVLKNYPTHARADLFNEWLPYFDDPQRDELLWRNPHIFDHRNHWHLNPAIQDIRKIGEKSRLRAIEAILAFALTGEHYAVIQPIAEDRFEEWLKDAPSVRRNDLYQIYFPEGFTLRNWLPIVEEAAPYFLAHWQLLGKSRPSPDDWHRWATGFFSAEFGMKVSYAMKNVARHLGMCFDDMCDINLSLAPGTGAIHGLQLMYDEPISDAQTIYRMYEVTHRVDPTQIHTHRLLNVEDKLCFFYKYLACRANLMHPCRPMKFSTGAYPPAYQQRLEP